MGKRFIVRETRNDCGLYFHTFFICYYYFFPLPSSLLPTISIKEEIFTLFLQVTRCWCLGCWKDLLYIQKTYFSLYRRGTLHLSKGKSFMKLLMLGFLVFKKEKRKRRNRALELQLKKYINFYIIFNKSENIENP